MRGRRIDDESVNAAVSLFVFHQIDQHLWLPQKTAKPLHQPLICVSKSGDALSSQAASLLKVSSMATPMQIPAIRPFRGSSFSQRRYPSSKLLASNKTCNMFHRYARLREALRGVSESENALLESKNAEGLLKVALTIIRAHSNISIDIACVAKMRATIQRTRIPTSSTISSNQIPYINFDHKAQFPIIRSTSLYDPAPGSITAS